MKEQDSEKDFSDLINEFRRTDEFYRSFRHKFTIELFLIAKRFYKELLLDEEMSKNLRLYADEIISCTETILYKDIAFSTALLEDEVEMISRIVVKEYSQKHNPEFIELTHLKAKELLVELYPEVFELSAAGFRLLEKYSRMYSWEFATNFYGDNITFHDVDTAIKMMSGSETATRSEQP